MPGEDGKGVRPSGGFVLLQRRNTLLRTMGESATGSAGLVLVPAKLPLSRALKAVREAEQRAKNAGRDRFSISVIKRSGGALQWTGEWPVPKDTSKKGHSLGSERSLHSNDMLTLIDLVDRLSADSVSSRFGFHMQAWARQLEVPWRSSDDSVSAEFVEMISRSLSWQLERQGMPNVRQIDLPRRIAEMVCKQPEPLESLRHLLGVAEFLVRKQREAMVSDTGQESTV